MSLDSDVPHGRAPHYGVVDTTFARVDMGDIAEAALRAAGVAPDRIVRRTVPGFKDLGVAAKRLVEGGCAAVVACGMVGPEPIDKQCAQDASFGIQLAQMLTSTHILEVFVHMDEVDNDADLWRVTENRVAEHAINAVWLVERPEELRRRAGTGQRQGFADAGPIAPPSRRPMPSASSAPSSPSASSPRTSAAGASSGAPAPAPPRTGRAPTHPEAAS